MKKMIVWSCLLITTQFLLTSCNSNAKHESVATGMDMAALQKKEVTEETTDAAVENAPPNVASPVAIERKLIKDGTFRWQTNSIEKTHKLLLDQTKKLDAYVSKDEQTRDEYQIANYMEIRIPKSKFDNFVTNLEKTVTNFDQKNITTKDVTEEYVDVQARLKTKTELESHYISLLKQTRNVAEILLVEEQLNIVRTDIETAAGRLKLLDNQVDYSTLYLTYYETTSAPVGFFGEIGRSIIEGWKGLLYFILGILKAWPFLLFIGVIVYFIVKKLRKKKV